MKDYYRGERCHHGLKKKLFRNDKSVSYHPHYAFHRSFFL
jgi:hypothetical protein